MSKFRSLTDADAVFAVAMPDGAVLAESTSCARSPATAALLLGHANGLPAGSYGPWLRDPARLLRLVWRSLGRG